MRYWKVKSVWGEKEREREKRGNVRILYSELHLQWKREGERDRKRAYVRYCILKRICSGTERERERQRKQDKLRERELM